MNRIEELRRVIDNILLCQEDLVERRCGYVHLYGVAACCGLLAYKRCLNKELATIAGMLHDIYSYKHKPTPEHGKLGAKEAKKIMEELNYFTNAEINLVCQAISKHSNKLDIDDPFDELLKDADVLQHHLYNIEINVSENERDRLERVLMELEIV